MMDDMKQETVIQAKLATPAVAGATIAGITLNEIVAGVTAIYVLVQLAYLIWKWHKEYKQGK